MDTELLHLRSIRRVRCPLTSRPPSSPEPAAGSGAPSPPHSPPRAPSASASPGGLVVLMPRGAAVAGSPLSGGYAGAKAAIRYIRAYAAGESDRAGLKIRFVALLPQLTPATDLGAAGIAGYAAREGVSPGTYAERFQPVLSP